MPFSYTVEPENRLLCMLGSGQVSMEDRYVCVDQILSDQSIDENLNILIDVCLVANCPSPGDISSIIALVERLKSRFMGRVAIVNATAGHVTITNFISFGAERGGNSVRSFYSDSEARKWLCSEMPPG